MEGLENYLLFAQTASIIFFLFPRWKEHRTDGISPMGWQLPMYLK